MNLQRHLLLTVFVLALTIVTPLTAQAAGRAATNLPPARPLAQGAAIHTVRKGETLAAIAAKYGTTVTALMQWNNLRNPNKIFVGQRLVVGSSSAAEPSVPGSNSHVVRRGETLSAIAKRYGTSIAALQQANGLRSTMIYVGQRLRIPTGGGNSGGSVAPAGVHVVQAGETLAGIAQRYGVSLETLAALNGISNTSLIRIGQRLAIPGQGGNPAQPLAPGKKKIVVSISQQRCWRYEGDRLLNTWSCSTGRNNSTAAGTFRVQSKLRKAYGSTWNIWMPYWLGIYWSGGTENGLHGLPWNASTGGRTWAGLVGTPITYGCVMLNDNAMAALWEWADIGTTVVIKR